MVIGNSYSAESDFSIRGLEMVIRVSAVSDLLEFREFEEETEGSVCSDLLIRGFEVETEGSVCSDLLIRGFEEETDGSV